MLESASLARRAPTVWPGELQQLSTNDTNDTNDCYYRATRSRAVFVSFVSSVSFLLPFVGTPRAENSLQLLHRHHATDGLVCELSG